MGIPDRIERDMVEAAKARDAARLGAIRYVRSEARNLEIELGRELREDDYVAILSRLVKQHREALEQFEGAGRDDLVEKERERLQVISGYLPEQLSESELREIVAGALDETDASGPGDMGVVMKAVMPKVRGRSDGKAVSALVVALLKERNV